MVEEHKKSIKKKQEDLKQHHQLKKDYHKQHEEVNIKDENSPSNIVEQV